MIDAREVYKSYNDGATRVLNGVSIGVAAGEFAVLLGASGSGKTTLLSVLSGLERVDNGSVACDGRELSAMTDKQLTAFRREYVGFIFQQYYLSDNLSVDGNVKLGAQLAGNKDYRDIIAAVGLADKLKRLPRELSGGEQQRVCIARALAKKPKILFLDEPTGALDEETGRSVLDYIIKLQKSHGFTAVMVTHNRNIAETADVVFGMNSGKIIDATRNASPKSAYEIGW